MRAKILGIAVTGILIANSAMAACTNGVCNMTLNSNVQSKLTVDNFNNVTDSTTLTALQNPDSLKTADIVDSNDLQGFSVYSNSGSGVIVNATNNAGNGQSPTAAAVLKNSAGGPSIPYQINYTACGNGPTVDLTTCTGSSGCPIPDANANGTICASAPGSGNYTFKQVGSQLTAGNYVGGTTLTFSAGL